MMAGPYDMSQVDWLAAYPPPRSLPLDQEALQIYKLAYYIGLKTEVPEQAETPEQAEKEIPPRISFTTVLIALLEGQDETSRWFAQQASVNGPLADLVYAEKKITREVVQGISLPPGPVENPELSTSDRQLLTISARTVLGTAEEWSTRVGGSDIGVRHLVAAYVLNPPVNHRRQLQRWQFQEPNWRSAFFDWIPKRYTAEQWLDVRDKPAPTIAIPSYEQQKVHAEELLYPSDPGADLVLDRAATYHARRSDSSLAFQTLFYALVDTAQDNMKVREAIQPLWDDIQIVRTQYDQLHTAYFPPVAIPESSNIFANVNISSRVLNLLETARELAQATRRNGNQAYSVSVMHLAGALLSRRVDPDAELAAISLDAQELRMRLIEYAENAGEPATIWSDRLGEEEVLRTGRPVALNSDEAEAIVRQDKDWTSDPLSIRTDVETFAALLASKSLEPPLSIGLFGPWGSGKTTFLRRLRRAVDNRAKKANDNIESNKKIVIDNPGAPLLPVDFVTNIVHIDFNAWHYAESALTSSLVDTIFRELNAYISGTKQNIGEEKIQEIRDKLKGTRRKVEAAQQLVAAKASAVEKAQETLEDARQKAADKTTSVEGAVGVVWKATKTALANNQVVKDSDIFKKVGDTVKSADELYAKLDTLRNRPAPLISALGWGGTLIFAALVIIVPVIVKWFFDQMLETDQASQLLAGATAMLSVIGVGLRFASGVASNIDQAIINVVDTFNEKIATNQDVIQAKAALDAAQASAATAAAELQQAQEELARAQAEGANAALPAQVLQLVSSRIQDQSYSKELTTTSLARADLEALSKLLRDKSELAASGQLFPKDLAATARAKDLDRIILYIDDLDRCKPEDVVRVLQIVHMLLAFELFIVVVAVDARWVEESLLQTYEWLAGSDTGEPNAPKADDDAQRQTAGVTPQDYLEKIFQISFWLEPMDGKRAASYMSSLVRQSTRNSRSGSGAASAQPTSTGSSIPTTNKIEISADELAFMKSFAGYVGPSPRRVKRLVNSYRLIKAGLPNSLLDNFLTDSTINGVRRLAPYQIVISLLVIGTGAPSNSAIILRELAGWNLHDNIDDVVREFNSRNHRDWTMAAQVIEKLLHQHGSQTVSGLREWAPRVGRFLQGGQAADLRLDPVRPHTSTR